VRGANIKQEATDFWENMNCGQLCQWLLSNQLPERDVDIIKGLLIYCTSS